MPLTKDALLRYTIIDRCLRNRHTPYPKRSQLIKALSEVGEISRSTLMRDIQAMRSDEQLGYFAPIEYCQKNQGYYYTDPNYTIHQYMLDGQDSRALDFIERMLKPYQDIPVVKPFIQLQQKIRAKRGVQRTYKKHYDFVQPEIQDKIAGLEWFNFFFQAIEKEEPVSFDYTRYEPPYVTTRHLFHPYFLKEYQQRWYVIGFSATRNHIRTFGLDRVSNPTRTFSADFYRYPRFNPDKYYRHMIGITPYNINEVHRVVLEFTPHQARYLKSVPLHDTQRVVHDGDEKCIMEYDLIMSYELIMKLLSFGPNVRVRGPEKLEQKMIELLSKNLMRYTDGEFPEMVKKTEKSNKSYSKSNPLIKKDR